MKEFLKAMDDLPFIVKLLLCIPALDIVWTVYRLIKSIDAKNTAGIVVSVILFFCAPFVWLVDLICVILNKKSLKNSGKAMKTPISAKNIKRRQQYGKGKRVLGGIAE